ncbi:MAG TPA: hypothetical protein VGW40_05125 [Allosphingosinicella sp.]|nr:hypothetical protein [Allosphingosinicella sp.]
MILAAALALSSPAAEPACTLRAAIPASVREMRRDPRPWLGRCVRLEGFVRWHIFYADVAGAYAASASNSGDRANDGWLGLDLGRGVRLTRDLRRGTVYGLLRDCARDYRAAAAGAGPDTLVTSIGYCHYRGGLVLRSAGFRVTGPARFERQTGEAARVRFGDLTPAGPDRPVPEAVEHLVDRFLAMVRAGDGEGLRRLAHPWSGPEPDMPAGNRAFTAFLLGEGDSPLRALRAAVVPRRAYFQEAAPREAAARGEAGDWHACFCRDSDCAGRWPIAAIDARAPPSRPYLCLRTYRHDMGRGAPDRIAVDRIDGGFAEPAAANGSTR